MEKTFQLDQKESVLLGQLEQERTQALATIGALSLDMEQARKNLDAFTERQRSFIRQAVNARGVERFDNARLANGALLVSVPEAPALPSVPLEGSGLKMVERVNGPIIEASAKE